MNANGQQRPFYIEDIHAAGFNLEPLTCKYCGSTETTFLIGVGDAHCETCGRWQDDPDDGFSDDEEKSFPSLGGMQRYYQTLRGRRPSHLYENGQHTGGYHPRLCVWEWYAFNGSAYVKTGSTDRLRYPGETVYKLKGETAR